LLKTNYVKSRMMGNPRSDKDERKAMQEEEMEKRSGDNVGSIRKTKVKKEEDSEKDYRNKTCVIEPKIKESHREDCSRSFSRDTESLYEPEACHYAGYREREVQEQSHRPKLVHPYNQANLEYSHRSRSIPINEEIIEEPYETDKTNEDRGPYGWGLDNRVHGQNYEEKNDIEEIHKDKQEMWDRKREELSTMNKKLRSQPNVSTELRGRDYATFCVSFGRTEIKTKKSLSPNSKAIADIMEVPRKKRIDPIVIKYDVITGKETSNIVPRSVKAEDKKFNARLLTEGSKIRTGFERKDSNLSNLEKVIGENDARRLVRE